MEVRTLAYNHFEEEIVPALVLDYQYYIKYTHSLEFIIRILPCFKFCYVYQIFGKDLFPNLVMFAKNVEFFANTLQLNQIAHGQP
jgi:hypothetical protein